ncbi:MAG: geranylgeranyl reductase family protein [candidate division NC10 bacterium]|nr:geranylgeranyl reductase family protein [candidate division NC10 bacterium]
MRVAVVGGGPSGSSAAFHLAHAGIETYLLEKSLQGEKPCGGGILPALITEFHLPQDLLERKVHQVQLLGPSGRPVIINLHRGFIGTTSRSLLDRYLRNRAQRAGALLVAGQCLSFRQSTHGVTLRYRTPQGEEGLEADLLVAADGANSTIAAQLKVRSDLILTTLQEHIHLPPEGMAPFEDHCEGHLNSLISPDFAGWVFPKGRYITIGIATHSPKARQLPSLLRNFKELLGERLKGGRLLRRESFPLPLKPLSHWVYGRVLLVGDAAGLVLPVTGEGIYNAMKSGQMAAHSIRAYRDTDDPRCLSDYQSRFGRHIFRLLQRIQEVYYRDDASRQRFLSLCAQPALQKVALELCLYRKVSLPHFSRLLSYLGLSRPTPGPLWPTPPKSC